MKKLKKICISAFCFLFMIFNMSSYAKTGTVTGSTVRLRKEASTDSTAITAMKKGEKVEILDEEGNWYKVVFEGKNGYASKEYIKEDEESIKTSENNANENVVLKNEEVKEEDAVEVQESNEEKSESKELIKGNEYTIEKNTQLRLKPNFSSITLTSVNSGTTTTANSVLGNWIEITVGDKTGWVCKGAIHLNENETENKEEEVKQEEVKPEETTSQTNTQTQETENTNTKIGYVNSDTVNVRAGASTDSKRIGSLDLNDEVEIIFEEGDWYKIKTKKYGECYIAKRLISPTKVASRGENIERTDTISEEKNNELTSILNSSSSEGSGEGDEIVEFAKQYLGYSYVSGGKTPETGFDCSGFTRYVYSNFGVSLGGSAASQEGVGETVAREDLQPGDLILFQDEGKTKIGHTGIYIGDNMFIHAANPRRGVVTDNLETNSYYSQRFVTAERF